MTTIVELLAELERDIYTETVSATGIDPLHDHCTVCDDHPSHPAGPATLPLARPGSSQS